MHVSINEAACYRTKRTLMEMPRIPSRHSRLPISALEFTNNEVNASSMSHWLVFRDFKSPCINLFWHSQDFVVSDVA